MTDTNIRLTLKNESNHYTNGRILYFTFANLRELTAEHKIKNLLIGNEFIDNILEVERGMIINTLSTVFDAEDLNIFIEEYRAKQKC